MTYLTDDERQVLLLLIGERLGHYRPESKTYAELVDLRRKLEGVDKRIKVEVT